MDTEKFINVVRRMRATQIEYFKTRNKFMQFRAMALEKMVDDMIKEHDDFLKKHPRQPDLFQE